MFHGVYGWSPFVDDFVVLSLTRLHFSPVFLRNFGTHEKQIIADHDPVQLVVKLETKYQLNGTLRSSSFPQDRMDTDKMDDHVVAFRVHVSS